MSKQYEIEDFNPSTGHLHSCVVFDCDCAAHLYVVASELDIIVQLGASGE